MLTIRQARRDGRAQLHESPSPALDARLLLAHALGRDHAYLAAHDDEALTAAQAAAYTQLLARAAAGEPIPYLLGRAPFFGLDFAVPPPAARAPGPRRCNRCPCRHRQRAAGHGRAPRQWPPRPVALSLAGE